MFLLKKKKVVKRKVVKNQSPLEYERFVKIKCPYCSKGRPADKQIFIELAEAGLPDTARCCVCDSVLYTKDLLKNGVEIKRR